MNKVTIGIIVALLIVIGLGGVWYMYHYNNSNLVENSTISPELKEREMAQNTSQSSTQAVTANSSLDSDLTTIDSQMKGMDQDSSNVDQSMNDQPISQE